MRPITAPGARTDEVLARVANWVDPVGLEELDTDAALRTRVDVKYLVDAVALHRVVMALGRSARVLELDARRSFRYRSVYFDTPDLASYRAHVQGRRRRYKIRTRSYLDAGAAMLELKYKGRRGSTVKRRQPHDPARVDELDGPGRAFLAEELQAAYGTGPLPPLMPSMVTDYCRTTFAVVGDGERITCDVDLRGRHAGREARLDPRLALVESKSIDGRGSVDRLLQSAGIRPVSISKHAVTVAATREDLPGNPWHRLLPYFRVKRYPPASDVLGDHAAISWAA